MVNFLKKSVKQLVYAIKRNPFQDQKKFFSSLQRPVIIDIGAHRGQTVLQYKKVLPKSMIYSFEPFKDSFNQLIETTTKLSNVKAFNLAVSNNDGSSDFHINRHSATNSILETDPAAEKTWGANLIDTLYKTVVPVVRLDSFLETERLSKVNILKIDTQGHEYSVLEGAEQALRSRAIDLIFIEILLQPSYKGQKHFDEILTLLRSKSYHLYNMYNFSYSAGGRLRQIDAIFLSQDFLE